jgi:hypothetical protein
MKFTRTIYRCTYVYHGAAGPVRDSRAFHTEHEARTHAADLIARDYLVVVWRERQRKNGNWWQTDLDDPITQPLDS